MPNSNTPISLARYEQLCKYNVPYYGYIKNADGTTTMLVETEINNHCWTIDGGISYWTKEIQVTMLEFKHIVGYKETPDNIAKALGISVEQVLGILPKKPATPVAPPTKESVTKITPMPNNASDNTNTASRAKSQFFAGQEIKIKLNKKFGYQANFMIDEGYFQQYQNRNLHQAIADNTLYQVADYIQNATDNLASSLAKHAGKSTFGLGGNLGISIYLEKNTGGVFYGNQYQSIYSMKAFGKGVGKWVSPKSVPAVAIAFEGVEIIDGIMEDGGFGRLFSKGPGYNTLKQTAGGVGSIGGSIAGFALAAVLTDGLSIPVSIIGSFLYGMLFGEAGEIIGERTFDAIAK